MPQNQIRMSKENLQIKSISFGATAIAAVLVILLLFLSFSFEIKQESLPILIELNLSESNFGQQNQGNTPVEPLPTNQPSSSEAISTPSAPIKTSTQEIRTKTQSKSPASIASPKTKTSTKKTSTQVSENKPDKASQGDSRAKSALENILGGKGNKKSEGEGSGSQNGNIGDPKGNDDQGELIGENWKTHVPPNQDHNCQASGTVIVDIVVNSQGRIKRATPRLSSSDCLAQTAKKLVLQYVTAHPGKDNRRGSYRINLK